MRSWAAVMVGALAACGTTSTSSSPPTSSPPSTSTSTTPSSTAPPTSASPSASTSPYELHEWGVVDVASDGSPVELAAGAGRIDRPMSVRKPVVYVRLLDGAAEVTFGLRVALSGGTIVEHYPDATFTGGGLEWPSIIARQAHESARYGTERSARRQPRCGTADGICEVRELDRYDAPSAAGLDVGGVASGLLFYRASVPSVALPISATRSADLTVHVTATASMAGAPGSIWRLSTALSGPWPAGRMVVSRAAFPAAGASVDLAVGTAVLTRAEGAAELGQALTALGLTEDERAAFMAGWGDDLFGPDDSSREARDQTMPAPRLQDVLLFFLPEPAVDGIATLTATPAPRAIRRAFLVRIDLGAVSTA